jgi:hypothetical protein
MRFFAGFTERFLFGQRRSVTLRGCDAPGVQVVQRFATRAFDDEAGKFPFGKFF